MTQQCKSCGGFCGKSGCERLNTNHPDYDKTEWDVRGLLAESLKCWHRLTGEEAAELVAFVQAAQAAQPAPRRLTEAEITLLVEAYYEDFGSAPPDLIRQVEGLIFGDAQPAQPGLPDCWVVLENGEIIGTHDAPVHIKGNAAIRYVPAQPAHAHAIDTSPERVEKQAGNVQVPGWLPIESAPKDEAVLLAVEFDGPGDWRIKCGWGDERGWHVWGASWKPTHWMPLPAAPSTKEGT